MFEEGIQGRVVGKTLWKEGVARGLSLRDGSQGRRRAFLVGTRETQTAALLFGNVPRHIFPFDFFIAVSS